MLFRSDYHFEEEFHREGKDFRDFGRNETWGELDQHYFFLADVAIPEQMEGHTVRAVLNTGATDIWNTDNPQIMAYVNGRFAATLDMNHQFIILSEHAKAGETYELAFYNRHWRSSPASGRRTNPTRGSGRNATGHDYPNTEKYPYFLSLE